MNKRENRSMNKGELSLNKRESQESTLKIFRDKNKQIENDVNVSFPHEIQIIYRNMLGQNT